MKFIKLHTIHPHNEELDTAMHFLVDEIVIIQEPTMHEHKQRDKTRAVLHLHGGNAYAIGENPEQVLAMIKEAELGADA